MQIGRLRKEGFRIGKTRKFMLELFFNLKGTITAAELKKELYQAGITSDRVTFYREINFLKKQKIISEIELGDHQKRYELAFNNHHHHLICRACKKVFKIELNKSLEKELEQVGNNGKFVVESHLLEFFGRCKNCLV